MLTDRQIAYFVEKKLRDHYQSFVEDILTDCKLPQFLGTYPVNIQTPIYGSDDMEFQQYVAPGVVMT